MMEPFSAALAGGSAFRSRASLHRRFGRRLTGAGMEKLRRVASTL
jgi:hypothetical protein